MLKEQRNNKGFSQRELAEVSGVNIRNIQAYEIGQRNVNGGGLEILCKLAKALDCKLYDILTDEQLIEDLKNVI